MTSSTMHGTSGRFLTNTQLESREGIHMDQTNTQEERVRNGCMVSFTMHAVVTGDWVAGHILGLFPAIVGENPKKQVLQRLWAYLGCCCWT